MNRATRLETGRMPIQIFHVFSDGTESTRKWRANAADLKPFFGIEKTAKWPAIGCESRVVEGVLLWVRPLGKKVEKSTPYGTRMEREGMHSRLMAKCPNCNKTVTYGRLHQHMAMNGGNCEA